MSSKELFKGIAFCDCWSVQCPDLEDNYDMETLLCTRFGLNEQEKDYLVVGSHEGYLSIFYPRLDTDGSKNAYKPTDLLLETKMAEPIIGVYAGKFSSNSYNENNNQLAVLQPMSLSIYNVQTIQGVAEHGTQVTLHLLCQHKFQRFAFSLCKGHFGKVKGREFICVVHLDGFLTFFEQEGISYECQFPGERQLPSPIVYCERTDSFIRCDGAWNLECFTYQDVSHSSINKSSYEPVWSVCIGEGVIDMCIVQSKEQFAYIMILGDKNLLRFDDNGKMDFILTLDYIPKCFYPFVIGYYWESNARFVMAVVSEDSKFFIYEDDRIIWAAQYKDEAPVAICRSNLNNLPGGIVTLGNTGQLRIGYLGSDQFQFKVPPLSDQNFTFSEAQKELGQLEEEIKEAVDVADMEAINRQAYDDVRISFSISPDTTDDADALMFDVSADVAIRELPSCTGTLKLRCKVDLMELQVMFNMPEGIRCSWEPITYVRVESGMTEDLEVDFYIAELLHVHSSRVDVVVSFMTKNGIPRVIQLFSHLPLRMFFKPRQPQKSAPIKLTFTITAESLTPKLSTFFPEFINWESDAHALGLLLICAPDDQSEQVITIVAAKNSNRLRIQSNSLEVMPLILERLFKVCLDSGKMENVKKKVKGSMNRRTKSILSSPFIPTQEILHRIDIHNETQENIRKQMAVLDALWDQYKTLQEKMQEQDEDEPKEDLLMQSEENSDLLITEGEKLMEMRKLERMQRCDLSCAITSAALIISGLRIAEKLINVILSVLSTPVEDWTSISWEESMSAGIDMLHHYGPLSRNKDAASLNINTNDSTASNENFEYSRFRKHFVLLFDRLMRIASSEGEPLNKVAEKVKKKPKTTENELTVLNKLMAQQQKIHKHALEAVEDEEEDDEDIRGAGYKKHEGMQNNQREKSEWLNENFELPTSEELFNDLGIWW